MVMDSPSPQNVGREFVRQYYTMLHEAPDYLHRFYSHNSSFVHGGVDHPADEQLPAVGQAEIHKKISSLKFHDCHAKIRQVDSQLSIGGSVVIQVVGELSNNGLPMRRFMQTFVLAQQTPKKFYVHNDIFRYQDEVFNEAANDENETIDECESTCLDREERNHEAVGVCHENETIDLYYEDDREQSPAAVHVVSNGEVADEEMMKQTSSESGEVVEIEGQTNEEERKPTGAAEEEEEEVQLMTTKAEEEKEELEIIKETEVEDQTSPVTVPTTVENELPAAAATTAAEEETTASGKNQLTEPEAMMTAAPQLTWAAMASKNTANPSSSSYNGPSTTGMTGGYAPKPQATIRPEMKVEMNSVAAQRTTRIARTEAPVQDGYRGSVDGGDDTGRNMQQYPDNQQVFVGNLPRNLADKELREFFEKFGGVLDMRINRKPNNNNLPNFGFVVFDSPETVQKVLSERPLMFNGKHRVNVEEKKPREELAAARPRSATHNMGKQGLGGVRGADLTLVGRGTGRQGPSPGGGSGIRSSYGRGTVNDEGKR